MGNCELDHSLEDVKNKLEDQKSFLPTELFHQSHKLLEENPQQLILNELFHALKKYDLVSEEEKLNRNIKIKELTQ